MPSRQRIITACQYLLVLGVVCAALTPAAQIASLQIGPADPDSGGSGTAGAAGSGVPGELAPLSMAAYSRAQTLPTQVPAEVVDPEVREYSLTAPTGARMAPSALASQRVKVARGGGARLVSKPQAVHGYGAVGVTWEHGTRIADDRIDVKVRTREQGRWSGWSKLDYHAEHGPDPDSAEAQHARQGTDGMFVGRVDSVQVKVVTDDATPPDLKLAVIDPGHAKDSVRQRPALDTEALDGGPQTAETPRRGRLSSSAGPLDLSAGSFTPKPQIFSRAQWGADESLRRGGTPSYFEVHAGFVHHTVNANDYSRAQVPSIIRGIYAYHTQSLGWSDVGYNFLVDRFGRIWEGRAGGVARPVVGAHTLGYNDNAFAMSAIGNFETAQPSTAMIQAYGALMAWKLSLHGVSASSTQQYVTSRNFAAINGHRDAGSTACPGRFLYAKLGDIRRLAAQMQSDWSGRQLDSNIGRSKHPDLLVRNTANQRAFVIPLVWTKEGWRAGKAFDTGVNLDNVDRVMNAGDWNRDGHTDMITRRSSDGVLMLRLGNGDTTYQKPVRLAGGFKGVELLAAVGDFDGDGWPDIMGKPKGGAMQLWPGRGMDGLGAPYAAYGSVEGFRHIPVGLWTADGAPDSLVRNGPRLDLYSGNGPGGFESKRTLTLDVSPYDWVVGISDIAVKGDPDLVVRNKSTGELFLIKAGRTGFSPPVRLGGGYSRFDLVN